MGFNIQQIPDIVAIALFDGNTTLASVTIVVVVLIMMFTIMRNITKVLVVSIPVVFIFNMLGWLATDLTLLMILVIVISLGASAGRIFT